MIVSERQQRATYKEGPQVRANGGAKANAPRDLDKVPHVRLPEDLPCIMAFPLLLLITFHVCIWWEPTLKTIKGASLHLSPHTPFLM